MSTYLERNRIRPPLAGRRGFTLIEMVTVLALLTVLAAVTYPTARYTARRLKEMELRAALRTMRTAIDEYKRYSDAGLIPIELGTDGYPREMEVLLEGQDLVGEVEHQVKFLRRIPIDPMTGEAEWGMRSYQDDWDSTSWGGENVFDVYSLSEGMGLEGVPYSLW